ncbi:30S ribosomal protein S13 [bacterium]|nr:30S ribosomal protein S13 [bacterium]
MRISGIDVPDNERLEIALTRIYGIGRRNVHQLLAMTKLDPDKRARELTPEEIRRIIGALEKFKIEGDLRAEIRGNIERLKRIRCYRGIRHILNLPVRGQRTRTNARTKRGKRKTVGALSKEMWAKIEAQQKEALGKT